MKITIKKGEYIFSEQGTHVCDESGIAIKAEADIDCEISEEHYSRVSDLVSANRLHRGLDINGNEIVAQNSGIVEEPIV